MSSDIIYLIASLVLCTVSFVIGSKKFGAAGALMDARIALAALTTRVRDVLDKQRVDGEVTEVAVGVLVGMLEQETLEKKQ